jgi:dolichol-phosphate mannosyltransferase
VELTVVLPFYNEEALLPTLPDVLQRIRESLSQHDVRIVCVDDGSTDGTAAGLAALEGIEVVTHEQNRGPGAAMATGIERATGDAVLIYDSDEAYDATMLEPLVAALADADADVATLSPYHPDGGVEGVGAFRLLLSRGASFLYRRRLKTGAKKALHTYTCAVRAYRLPTARTLLPAPDDFTAAAYLMVRALRSGLSVVEIPAVLQVRSGGASKMRVWRTIRAHLRLLRDLSVTPGPEDRPAA